MDPLNVLSLHTPSVLKSRTILNTALSKKAAEDEWKETSD